MSDWPINWPAIVAEAVRRREQEGLSQRKLAEAAGVSVPTLHAFEQGEIRVRLESAMAILTAVGMVVQPDRRGDFDAFRSEARIRWTELTKSLPRDAPVCLSTGFSEQAYALEGLKLSTTSRDLQHALGTIAKPYRWSPFWMPTLEAMRPTVSDHIIEHWLGRHDNDRISNNPTRGDFWRVSRDGFAYFRCGYQEDGSDLLKPGTIFDVCLPIWRTVEILLHAVKLTRALGATDEITVFLKARYTGLAGRNLINWTQPLERIFVNGIYRAHSADVNLETKVSIKIIETEIEGLVEAFLRPLYAVFDGYHIDSKIVNHVVKLYLA